MLRDSPPRYSKERDFVLSKHPDAYVHDDGESIDIYKPKEMDSPCCECKRPWKRSGRILDSNLCLGSAGSEPYAWIRAAQSLGYKEEAAAEV